MQSSHGSSLLSRQSPQNDEPAGPSYIKIPWFPEHSPPPAAWFTLRAALCSPGSPALLPLPAFVRLMTHFPAHTSPPPLSPPPPTVTPLSPHLPAPLRPGALSTSVSLLCEVWPPSRLPSSPPPVRSETGSSSFLSTLAPGDVLLTHLCCCSVVSDSFQHHGLQDARLP